MEMYLMFIFGMIIGGCIALLFFKPKRAGILNICSTEPDEDPNLFLELEVKPEVISDANYVTFKVKNLHM